MTHTILGLKNFTLDTDAYIFNLSASQSKIRTLMPFFFKYVAIIAAQIGGSMADKLVLNA
jgi:hypothetical protein